MRLVRTRLLGGCAVWIGTRTENLLSTSDRVKAHTLSLRPKILSRKAKLDPRSPSGPVLSSLVFGTGHGRSA